ncbi:unnamed protein product [Coregonus sp. 'balchen']|nr:unnamed protein product [Coregonus sp. 'balchen']
MEDGFSSYSSLYDTSSLLQFCNGRNAKDRLIRMRLKKQTWPFTRHDIDDSVSAASSMEVTDRIASLEQRVQMQEDEIQLLKSALADVKAMVESQVGSVPSNMACFVQPY